MVQPTIQVPRFGPGAVSANVYGMGTFSDFNFCYQTIAFRPEKVTVSFTAVA